METSGGFIATCASINVQILAGVEMLALILGATCFTGAGVSGGPSNICERPYVSLHFTQEEVEQFVARVGRDLRQRPQGRGRPQHRSAIGQVVEAGRTILGLDWTDPYREGRRF